MNRVCQQYLGCYCGNMAGVITSEKFDVQVCKCERCGHKWVPSVTLEKGKLVQPIPIACAACKSAYWNRPKKGD
jgi:hypothetical protein